MADFRTGSVGILGRTNVGKSTFLNTVMGEKLLITSTKPQTTRNRIRCVYTTDTAQIVFVDTPGLHQPHTQLGRYILRASFRALREIDLLMYMVEARGEVNRYDRLIFNRLMDHDYPIFLLVNKIDRASDDKIKETLLAYSTIGRFAELIPVCALRGDNVDEVIRTVVSYLPQGKPLFDPSVRTDCSEEFLVGELIREKIFQSTFHELPYSTAVQVTQMSERKDGLIKIHANIIVDRNSQKGIIVGKGGKMIKKIGTQARRDIESLLGTHVFIDLRVKTASGWTKEKERIEQLVGRD